MRQRADLIYIDCLKHLMGGSMSGMFTCKKCNETKPLEGFYTNSKIDKNKPYQLICRKCYQANRKARESGLNVKRPTYSKTPTSNPRSNEPTLLRCSIAQFHSFLGPKVRNEVQLLTKRAKRDRNHLCEKCNKKSELEAAHVRGNNRKQIINSTLQKYYVDQKNGIIQVDLAKVLSEIMEAHKPISEHFLFLCRSCHNKYHQGEAGSANSKDFPEVT
jgi:hypothetical protein